MGQQEKIGVAVIGLGVGRQHALTLASDPRCSVCWLLDLEVAKAAAVADELSCGAKIAADYQTILADPQVNLVVIASYDDAHFDQAMAALAAGKHVFVEKPICQNLDQLRRMKAAFVAAGGKLKIGSNLILRAAPLYQWLRQQVRDGVLGQIYSFDGDYLYGRIHKLTEGWRGLIPTYSGMQGGGIHLIDLMLWIVGDRPSSIQACGNRICTDGTQFKFNDYLSATMQSADGGMIARITANLGCVHRHHHVMRIFGTKGTFIYDDAGPRLHTTRDESAAAQQIDLSGRVKCKGALLPDFVTAIIDDRPVDDDLQAVFDGLSIAAACEKSLATGQRQEVEYV